MFNNNFLKDATQHTRGWLTSSILIISAISWFFASSGFLQGLLNKVVFNANERFYIWSATFSIAVFSIMFGAFLSSKLHLRARFLLIWVTSGIIVSFTPLIGVKDTMDIIVLLSLFVATWGFGIPICMDYFVDSTVIENRAKIGGIILSSSLLLGASSKVLLASEDIVVSSFYLACLRAFSLICFLFKQPYQVSDLKKKINNSFISVIKEKSFVLYLVPCTLFILVNDLSAPIASTVQSEEFVSLMAMSGTVLAGIFSILGGFFADHFGRKPVVIIGFVMLGLGYATLGLFLSNLLSWFFYMIVDGIAWGMLFAIFLITLWGDLAANKSSEKYYALGFMPFILSSFLSLTIGQNIANLVPANAIFSFASFFLFLAVVPLMFAPETLPEKAIRERELRRYIEKAKKIKEKFT